MADDKVDLSVRADLAALLQQLGALNKTAMSVAENMRRMGDDLDKNIQRNTKKTEKHFEALRDLGRRVADQLRGYFKSLADEAGLVFKGLQKDLGLKQQFKEATAGAIELHSVIQRIAPALGIAADRMSAFQQSVTDALGQFGQGNISKALEGISQTQIRGEGNITSAARAGLELGTMTGTPENAGELVKALSSTAKARGGEGNKADELRAMAEMARHVFNVTGQAPAETLNRAQNVYSTMSAEDRKRITPEAMGKIQAAGGAGIDDLFKFLTDAKKLASLPARFQGLGNLFGSGGINFDQLKRVSGAKGRIGPDAVSSLETLGLSEDGSRSLLRLIERSKGAQARQERYGTEGGSLRTQAAGARGLPQNQQAIKDQVQSGIGGLFAPTLERINKHLGFAAQTKGGSALALGLQYGAAVLGAGITSQFAKALGGGKVGAFAESGSKAALLEQATGQKTVPVWVVNFGELDKGLLGDLAGGAGGGGGGKGGMAKGLLKAAGQAGIVGAGAVLLDQVLQVQEAKDAEIERQIAIDEANPLSRAPPTKFSASGPGAKELLDETKRGNRQRVDQHKENRAQRAREKMHPGAPETNRGLGNGPAR